MTEGSHLMHASITGSWSAKVTIVFLLIWYILMAGNAIVWVHFGSYRSSKFKYLVITVEVNCLWTNIYFEEFILDLCLGYDSIDVAIALAQATLVNMIEFGYLRILAYTALLALINCLTSRWKISQLIRRGGVGGIQSLLILVAWVIRDGGPRILLPTHLRRIWFLFKHIYL